MQSTRQLHPKAAHNLQQDGPQEIARQATDPDVQQHLAASPSEDDDQKESLMAPDSDVWEEELPSALETDYEMVKSPTAEVPSAVPDRVTNELESLEISWIKFTSQIKCYIRFT